MVCQLALQAWGPAFLVWGRVNIDRSLTMVVTYEVGQKNVLLNNYLYDFNMISLWFAIHEAGKSLLADYDSTLISLWLF